MASAREGQPGWWKWWLKLRDIILFIGGMAGVSYETLQGHPQVDLLILFGGMVGVPIFLPGGIKAEFTYRTKKTRTEAKVDISHHGGHESDDG